jgi:hypothetical protein
MHMQWEETKKVKQGLTWSDQSVYLMPQIPFS